MNFGQKTLLLEVIPIIKTIKHDTVFLAGFKKQFVVQHGFIATTKAK